MALVISSVLSGAFTVSGAVPVAATPKYAAKSVFMQADASYAGVSGKFGEAVLADGKTRTAGMTVAESKAAFQSVVGNRALSMELAAFSQEIMQSTTFATASANYRYSRVMALGFRKLCDTFIIMTDDDTKLKVQEGLCAALADFPSLEQVNKDAESLTAEAEGKDEAALLEMAELSSLSPFKYTYISGAGLCALMQAAGLSPETSIPVWSEKLSLNCKGALGRDYDYSKTAITKLEGMKDMLEQMKTAGDRRKAEAAEKKAEKAEEAVPPVAA